MPILRGLDPGSQIRAPPKSSKILLPRESSMMFSNLMSQCEMLKSRMNANTAIRSREISRITGRRRYGSDVLSLIIKSYSSIFLIFFMTTTYLKFSNFFHIAKLSPLSLFFHSGVIVKIPSKMSNGGCSGISTGKDCKKVVSLSPSLTNLIARVSPVVVPTLVISYV